MKKIIITSPEPVSGEVLTLCQLLDDGAFAVHIRRPSFDIEEYRRLLDAIPSGYHSRIVIHDYFELYNEYKIKGIHLNRRNMNIPLNFSGSISCSCHSLDEVKEKKQTMDYVFLSPIFDSISKVGYRSAFTVDELIRAASDGIIDDKVFALGGVTIAKLPLLQKLSFGGFAMMGDVWKDTKTSQR